MDELTTVKFKPIHNRNRDQIQHYVDQQHSQNLVTLM